MMSLRIRMDKFFISNPRYADAFFLLPRSLANATRSRQRSFLWFINVGIVCVCLPFAVAHGVFSAAEDQPRPRTLPAAPAPDMLREQHKLVRDTYGSEIAAAKTAEQRRQLGAEFRRVAATTDKLLDRFVLLEGARKFFADSGDLDTACSIIDEIGQNFQIDANALLRETVATSQDKWDPSTSASAAQFLAKRISDGLDAGDTQLAKDLLPSALSAARKGKAKDLVADLTRLQAEIERRRRLQQKLDDALEALSSDPHDSEAHLVVGGYYCFVEENWTKGLPHLAKSADDAAQLVATRELRMTTAGEVLSVAEDWLAWAATQKGREKEAWRLSAERHARTLVTDRLEKLTGLERARAEKLLAAAADRGDAKLDPRSLPGLILWLDATDASTLRGLGLQVASIGSPVTTWADKAKGPLQAVSHAKPESRPVLGLIPQSKLPALAFDGIDDILSISDWPSGVGTGLTAFIVIGIPPVAPNGSATIETILDNRHDQSGGFEIQIRGDQKGSPLEFATWPLAEGDKRALHDLARVRPQLMVVAGTSSGREDMLFVNGIRVASVPTKQPVICRELVLLGAWQPPYANAPGRHFCGQIAELIVYRRALSAAEITGMSKSLGAKWMAR